MPPHDIDEGLQEFLQRATAHRLLNAAEEIALARAAGRGDEASRHKLVTHNIRLVVSIARYYRNRGLPFADVIQEGMLGLDRASRKFDPERGFRFTTYATLWIRQSIQRGLSGAGSTIRLPPHIAERRAKARAARLREDGRDASLEDLAEELELPVEQVRQALEAAEVVISLDREIKMDDEYAHSLLDTIADPHAVDPGEELPVDTEYLHAALAKLPELQRQVLELRFGFDGSHPRSLAEVAAALGKSTTTVQTAQRMALKKLREALDSNLV